MQLSNLLFEFQSVIGYVFKDGSYLERALIHSSYANENKMAKVENNERLEFLGDAVLEVITSNFLFHQYPDMQEGELTKLRASIVCEPTLAKAAIDIRLGNYLLLGKGEEQSGGRQRSSVLSDSLEALIGAIYLDGGLEVATRFVMDKLLKDIESRSLFIDSKTHLQELIQKSSDIPLEYEILNESGPDHNKLFEVAVKHKDVIIGRGLGKSKKSAEQEAAFDAINKFRMQ